MGALESVQNKPPVWWSDRYYALRDRLLANQQFHRWAAGFWLTRPVARRRAKTLFDLCAGFVYSQILFACVRLRLFEILSEGPQPIEMLAKRLSLPMNPTRRLIDAAVSLRLVERRGGDRFGLGVLGAAFIGNPSIAAMVEHHSMLYADLCDPVALLRGERTGAALARYWAYASAPHPEELTSQDVAGYSGLMFASQELIAADVLDAYPLCSHRCLLDVGGGEGAFLLEAARRAAELRLMLFDLPAVADRARQKFASAGLSSRATAIGGNFLSQPLPLGADIVTLVRVVHDHDDGSAVAILRNVRRALHPKGGALLIAEPMAATPGAENVASAYFGFYLLAMGQGRARTPDELTRLLKTAGFEAVQSLRTRRPMLASALLASAY
jgi:demethylspheroidene O-methyltransferase